MSLKTPPIGSSNRFDVLSEDNLDSSKHDVTGPSNDTESVDVPDSTDKRFATLEENVGSVTNDIQGLTEVLKQLKADSDSKFETLKKDSDEKFQALMKGIGSRSSSDKSPPVATSSKSVQNFVPPVANISDHDIDKDTKAPRDTDSTNSADRKSNLTFLSNEANVNVHRGGANSMTDTPLFKSPASQRLLRKHGRKNRDSFDNLVSNRIYNQYLDKTPENGYKSLSTAQDFKSHHFDVDSIVLAKDDPVAFLATYEGLKTALIVASASKLHILCEFSSITRETDFMKQFFDEPQYNNAHAAAIFHIIGTKMAIRFKADDFCSKETAPEAKQIIERHRMEPNGWIILQDLVELFHPVFGNTFADFDPHQELATLKFLPNETQSEFLLRCTMLRSKFDLLEGPVPHFRLIHKIVCLLFQKVQELKPVLNELFSEVRLHLINHGFDNNAFDADIEEISKLFKAYGVPLSLNLNPVADPSTANIAALHSDIGDFSDDSSAQDVTDANISAADGSKSRRKPFFCEICFAIGQHPTKYCFARGDLKNNPFVHEEVKRRGQQFNLRVQEFSPPQPPRPPRRPISHQSSAASLSSSPPATPAPSSASKKPLSKESRNTIASLVTKYFTDDSAPYEICNRDKASICSLSHIHDPTSDQNAHPLAALESLEKLAASTSPDEVAPKDESNTPTLSAMVNAATAPSLTPSVAYTTSDEVLILDPTSNVSSQELQAAQDTSRHAALISAMSGHNNSDLMKYEMFNPTVNWFSQCLDIDSDSPLDTTLTHDSESVGSVDSEELILETSSPDTSPPPVSSPSTTPSTDPPTANLSAIVSSDPSQLHTSSILDPSICSNIASFRHAENEPGSEVVLDQAFLNRILMAQRNYGAPNNLVSLIQRGILSQQQVTQFITRLEEQDVGTHPSSLSLTDPFSPPSSTPVAPGSGTISSPIDLSTSPRSSTVIDLTTSPPATIAASTSGTLRNEPSPNVQDPTQDNASIPTDLVPPVSNQDGSFNEEGMRRFSS